MAATRKPAALRQDADAGRADAQYALSIALQHGLGGLSVDQEQAAVYRRKALTARGFMPITTYIAGLNGAPGRVGMIQVPRYDFSGARSALVERRVARLTTPSPVEVADCGGGENYLRLRRLWRQAGGSP